MSLRNTTGLAWRLPTLRSCGLLCALAALTGSATGCHQDMWNQPRYKALAKSDFFTDGASARPQVPGTVPFGYGARDDLFHTGKENGQLVNRFPFPVTREAIQRGQQRFEIYCAPCHGRVGDGTGMIVQRGFKRPPSYHIDRLRAAPVGHFFDVMTNGFGTMYSYAARVSVEDRWAIAAYIRTLQYSQYAPATDLTDQERATLASGLNPAAAATASGEASAQHE